MWWRGPPGTPTPTPAGPGVLPFCFGRGRLCAQGFQTHTCPHPHSPTPHTPLHTRLHSPALPTHSLTHPHSPSPPTPTHTPTLTPTWCRGNGQQARTLGQSQSAEGLPCLPPLLPRHSLLEILGCEWVAAAPWWPWGITPVTRVLSSTPRPLLEGQLVACAQHSSAAHAALLPSSLWGQVLSPPIQGPGHQCPCQGSGAVQGAWLCPAGVGTAGVPEQSHTRGTARPLQGWALRFGAQGSSRVDRALRVWTGLCGARGLLPSEAPPRA